MEINIEQAINYLLFREYLKEFIVEDGLNQHRSGLNFEDWLKQNKLLK